MIAEARSFFTSLARGRFRRFLSLKLNNLHVRGAFHAAEPKGLDTGCSGPCWMAADDIMIPLRSEGQGRLAPRTMHRR